VGNKLSYSDPDNLGKRRVYDDTGKCIGVLNIPNRVAIDSSPGIQSHSKGGEYTKPVPWNTTLGPEWRPSKANLRWLVHTNNL